MQQMVMGVVAAAVVVRLSVSTVLVAEETNDKPVNPEAKKLVDKLTADIDALQVLLPHDVKEEDKARPTEELGLLKESVKAKRVSLGTSKVFAQEVTGQNADNAEESAGASEELAAQARTLNEMVAQLVALVGGGNGSKRRRIRKAEDTTRSTTDVGRHSGRSDGIWHQMAQDRGVEKKLVGARSQAVANIMPLDDDETSLDDSND